MVRWLVGSILHVVNPLSYFSFQPVLHDWCNKGRGMCYPVCGMVHIKEPLLLIVKSSVCVLNLTVLTYSTKVKASDLKSLVDELEVGQELDLYFVDCKSPSSFVAQIIEETRVKNFQQVLKEIVDDMAASPPLTPYRLENFYFIFKNIFN